MSAPVEDRLRRALAHQAETTTTSPGAWGRIGARIDRPRRYSRRALLAPAGLAVLAVLVVVAVVAVVDRGGDRTLRVTGDPGRLYLVPTGVEPRFRLVQADNGPEPSPLPPWTFRVFGRTGPDGVALEASALITVPADRVVGGTTPEAAPLRVLGRDVAVAVDDFGQRILSWTQAGGQTVGVATFGLSDAELVALAASLLSGDAANAPPALPPGFALVGSGARSGTPPRLTTQTWEADDGDRFMLNVAESPEAIGDVAWWLPGGRALELRGTTAIYLGRKEAFLAWIEGPGTAVTLQVTGLSEKELVDIAKGLKPVDDEAWQELVSRVRAPLPPSDPGVPQIGPPPGVTVSEHGYLQFLPVKARTTPPCVAVPAAIVMAERTGGQEVACYQVTRPLVDAGDIAGAEAREDRMTGHWDVRFTLTPDGARRFRQLYDAVGAGGQFAVLLDGQIVSVPRFSDAAPGDIGVVTGLDEATARSLADRLRR